jgi:TrmH family RNA methyltransferase
MVSKNTIKLIKSLAIKKYRTKENLFLVEGDKMVTELFRSNIVIKHLIFCDKFDETSIPENINIDEISEVSYEEIKKISLLKHPQNSMAVCHIPVTQKIPEKLENNVYLYLDNIQDPGNLGTIIRIADWYGISTIFCSSETVDVYNPKVIQASMGSYARVKVIECNFEDIKQLSEKTDTPIYGAFMNGENVYQEKLPRQAIIVMGNEGNGIRAETETKITHRLSIPNFAQTKTKAESLNVSVATAILCSEFKRNYSK